MNVVWLSVCLVIGIIGHAINRWCDYILAVYPNEENLEFEDII